MCCTASAPGVMGETWNEKPTAATCRTEKKGKQCTLSRCPTLLKGAGGVPLMAFICITPKALIVCVPYTLFSTPWVSHSVGQIIPSTFSEFV